MNHNELRQNYLPEPGNLNTLLVAEAAPDSPDRFFYQQFVPRDDWLYLAVVKAIYPDARKKPVRDLRDEKSDYLNDLQGEGYYLIDALDEHLPSTTTYRHRIEKIRQNAKSKIDEAEKLVQDYGHGQTQLILIKATVFHGLYEPLQDTELKVPQERPIPFPSCGRQTEFMQAMDEII